MLLKTKKLWILVAKVIDNEKVTFDESIRRLDANLLEQVNVVNRAFNDVETAYQNRITANCKSDLFWRITSIDTSTSPIEYGQNIISIVLDD